MMNDTKRKIRILKIESEKAPYEKEIVDKLEDIQAVVNGPIQCIYLNGGCLLVCNEEGKLNGMQLNRRIGNDIITGPFFIVGVNIYGEFVSLTDGQIESFAEEFREIEMFNTEEFRERSVIKFSELGF